MQLNSSICIMDKANHIVKAAGSREPELIADYLGIIIMPVDFTKQKGVYKEIERNCFIFIKKDRCPEMHRIVLLHEIGHAVLHRNEAKLFSDLNLFHMKNDRMEYEANCFVAEVALPDDEVLNYIQEGFDMEQIAKAMNTDRYQPGCHESCEPESKRVFFPTAGQQKRLFEVLNSLKHRPPINRPEGAPISITAPSASRDSSPPPE